MMRQHNAAGLTGRPRGRDDERIAFFDGRRIRQRLFFAQGGDDNRRPESGQEALFCGKREALVDREHGVVVVLRALHGVDECRAAWEIQGDQSMHFR